MTFIFAFGGHKKILDSTDVEVLKNLFIFMQE